MMDRQNHSAGATYEDKDTYRNRSTSRFHASQRLYGSRTLIKTGNIDSPEIWDWRAA